MGNQLSQRTQWCPPWLNVPTFPVVFQRSEDWQIDFASYKWTKLDPDSQETKDTVKKYFACEGDFGGKEVASYKIYK